MNFEILSSLAAIGVVVFGIKIFISPSYQEIYDAKRLVIYCFILYVIFMFCAQHPEKVEAWLNTPIFG